MKTILSQLQLAKYIFQSAKEHLRANDPMSCGLAISLAQDAIEILTWTVAKEKNISVKDKESFTGLLDKIEDHSGTNFPYKAKVLEINAIRVKFKHFGNLPIPDDAAKLLGYAEDCLRESTKKFFSAEFDLISLADLITPPSIRDKLKEAENYLAQGKFTECLGRCGEADLLISRPLNDLLPKADTWHLRDAGDLFDQDRRSDGRRVFQYIGEYMDALRAVSIAGLLNLGDRNYFKYRHILPIVHQMMDGSLQVHHKRSSYSEEDARFCLKYVIELGVRVQQWTDGK